jgi:hypothetical protein
MVDKKIYIIAGCNGAKHELLADKQMDASLNILNIEKFNLLKNYYDNN